MHRIDDPFPLIDGNATAEALAARARLADLLLGKLAVLDIETDLAENLGSARWWRGFGLMLALILAAIGFWPGFGPVPAPSAMRLDAAAREEFANRLVIPLAWGGDTGRRMGPSVLVTPAAFAPERPRIDLVSIFAPGDTVSGLLQRAGAASGDAARAAALVDAATPDGIRPGTSLAITLGPRVTPDQPRRLDHLAVRARIDLALALSRTGGGFALVRQPLPVDQTPLRIRGKVGSSLFLSARAAGVPISAIQRYLQTLDAHMSLDDMHAGDSFDIILAYKRAAGGESEEGDLLYAGLERDGQPIERLLRWGNDGQFYDASGSGEQRATSSGLVMPVAGGHITSGFGMRFHPILGYTRMHSGIDLGAPWGAPIYAVADGTVVYAGPHGGHGNYVRLEHGSGIGTGYAHMSRIAVEPGLHVRAGQVIGYVGSSGLSTGPHLHYEVYRDGQTVDPMSFHFTSRVAIDQKDLAAFKAKVAELMAVKPGAALKPYGMR